MEDLEKVKTPQRAGQIFDSRLLRLFNETDYAIIRTLIEKLPNVKRRILEMHFWEGLSLTEIAATLGMDWARINREIKEAFKTLKISCENDPRFSRHRRKHQMMGDKTWKQIA